MNATLTMVKKNVVIEDGNLKIYHGGFVETQKAYDTIIHCVMSYLLKEGFLDDHFIVDVQIFDYKGKQIIRSWCV